MATSTNPNSMNKAARREYQALTKFTISGWFWECCADVVLKRWPLWTCKFGGGCTLVVSSSTFSIFRLFAALPLVFSATLIFWEAFPVVSLPPPIALGVPSQLVQLFFSGLPVYLIQLGATVSAQGLAMTRSFGDMPGARQIPDECRKNPSNPN